MTPFIIILAVLFAANIYFLIHNLRYNNRVTQKDLDLDMRESRIIDKEDALLAENVGLKSLEEEHRKEIDRLRLRKTPVEVSASYIVTEADEMKYNTDKAILANAKNRLAMTIAHDIVKDFEPEESATESGRRKFTYKLYVTE